MIGEILNNFFVGLINLFLTGEVRVFQLDVDICKFKSIADPLRYFLLLTVDLVEKVSILAKSYNKKEASYSFSIALRSFLIN